MRPHAGDRVVVLYSSGRVEELIFLLTGADDLAIYIEEGVERQAIWYCAFPQHVERARLCGKRPPLRGFESSQIVLVLNNPERS